MYKIDKSPTALRVVYRRRLTPVLVGLACLVFASAFGVMVRDAGGWPAASGWLKAWVIFSGALLASLFVASLRFQLRFTFDAPSRAMTLHFRYFGKSVARAGPLPIDASVVLQSSDDSFRPVLRLLVDGRAVDVALANQLVEKATAEDQAATWRGFFRLH